MGFIIVIAAAVAVVIALAIDVVLVGAGVAMVAGVARRRRNVWPTATIALVIGMILTIAVVALWPYQNVRPGNDYDIAMFNMAVQGFGCTISIGVGAIVAAIAAFFCPKKTDFASLKHSPARGATGHPAPGG